MKEAHIYQLVWKDYRQRVFYLLQGFGLSATVGNLKEAARFISGVNRKCAILIDNSMRIYDIDVRFIKGSLNNVAHFIIDYVRDNKIKGSILLFTNTRDEAEYLGTILKNQKEIEIDVHHGSLSKDIREDTESKLRTGVAGIVVCTSSLELGLDIGCCRICNTLWFTQTSFKIDAKNWAEQTSDREVLQRA